MKLELEKKELIPSEGDIIVTNQGKYLVCKENGLIRLVSLMDFEIYLNENIFEEEIAETIEKSLGETVIEIIKSEEIVLKRNDQNVTIELKGAKYGGKTIRRI